MSKTPPANKLLERLAEDSYIDEWTRLLSQDKKSETLPNESSLVIFRLYREWLALSTLYFSGVLEGKTVHRIPHRDPEVLLGIINLGGRLKVCVNMHHILQVDSAKSQERRRQLPHYSRILSIQKEGDEWVFPVDEIDGIVSCDLSLMQNIPVNVAKSAANFLKGVIILDQRRIGCIDETLLFDYLQRGFS